MVNQSHEGKMLRLVYYEAFDRIEDAIAREKQVKKWNRKWKLRLISKTNPTIRDLANEIWSV